MTLAVIVVVFVVVFVVVVFVVVVVVGVRGWWVIKAWCVCDGKEI